MDIPPSYEEAVSRKHIPIIAAYLGEHRLLARHDLYDACLVSREWRDLFQAALWDEPTAFFGQHKDDIYHAYLVFLECLKFARTAPRSAVRILDFSGLKCYIYEDPHWNWLVDILTYLPNLQALNLSRAPSVTLTALQSLHPTKFPQGFKLRHLNLSGNASIKSSALPFAFECFRKLEYLDLSSTSGVRRFKEHERPSNLELRHLQVLRLANLGLTDNDLFTLHVDLQHIWSLDVTNNALSDACADKLIKTCLSPPEYTTPSSELIDDHGSDRDLPLRLPVSADRLPNLGATYRRDDEELIFINSLRNTRVSNAEFVPFGRLTHLYISSNKVTAGGIEKLINHGSLKVLDCAGTVMDPREQQPFNVREYSNILGLAKLVNCVARRGRSLCKLRIYHSFITGAASLMDKEPHCWGRYTPSDKGRPLLQPSKLQSPFDLAGRVFSLDTLTLTNVPTHSGSGEISQALQAFFGGLAQSEETLVEAEREAGGVDGLSEGVEVALAGRRFLRTLELEMVDRNEEAKSTAPQASLSVTEDPVSEDFLRSSEGDFSFFAAERTYATRVAPSSPPERDQKANDATSSNKETGARQSMQRAESLELYRQDGPRLFDAVTWTRVSQVLETSHREPIVFNPEVDVVASLSKFRKDRKAAHAAAVREGLASRGNNGHWSGRVSIVRGSKGRQ
ncbi:MAG: hypothetical protein M1833_002075 [Piccolia ochrophora]|nr:MAG: hypothetical protein M1833_002075 [Piccolia ochrophora]